jgi:hypothetical protein
VVDQSHFGVGLCWWLPSGLFAQHAEFAWHDKYGSAPVSRSRACGQASGACKRCPNVRQPPRSLDLPTYLTGNATVVVRRTLLPKTAQFWSGLETNPQLTDLIARSSRCLNALRTSYLILYLYCSSTVIQSGPYVNRCR